jgi:hypothetical protein
VTGPVAAGSTITVPIAGTTVHGASIPATGVTAVAASFTVTGQSGSGFLTIYPDGADRPDTSAMDFTAGADVTNSAIVPVGPDGKIAIYAYGASANILVDVTGYFTSTTTATGASTYTPLANSSRVLLTTNGTGVPKAQVPASSALAFHIADNNGTTGAPVTASNVTAVALNIGAIAASGDNGWVAAYPDGITRPAESVVSFTGGQTSATTVIVPVSASNGKIDLYNGSGSPIDLVGDLAGYFTTSATGQYYHSTTPLHVIDTRNTVAGAVGSNKSLSLGTPAGITADNPALVLNVTTVSPSAGGYLRAYPGSQSPPGTSIVNFGTGETIAAMALVNTATQNNYVITNVSGGTTDLIVVSLGYFS